jgi:hypothetical protein
MNHRPPTAGSLLLRCIVGLALATALGVPAMAADAGPSADAGIVDDGGLDAGAIDPDVVLLRSDAERVRDLLAEKLDVAVAPASLFEVPIDDDRAVALEAERLRALISAVDGGAPNANAAHASSSHEKKQSQDAGSITEEVPADLWAARIDLDRARLSFYELPAARRRELLSSHEKQKQVASSTLSEADRRAADAEAQRQLALKAARDARSEAERLVATDYAHLLDVDHAQALYDSGLARSRAEIAARREATLGWQRRAGDAKIAGPTDADPTYDDLRRALRASRDAFSVALDDLSADSSAVPRAGPDPLANQQLDVDTTAARKERVHVEGETARLITAESQLRSDRAAALLDEIDTLNHERLGLLDALSPEKRAAVTGLTSAGWDQAKAEARQLTLVLRYHRFVVTQWILSLRHPRRALEGVLAGGVLELLEWLFAFGVFIGWRRRSTALLRALHARAEKEDRHARPSTSSISTRLLGFAVQVHRPLEWLILVCILQWILPASTQQILEVRILWVFFLWILGGALAVDTVNAIAGRGRARTTRTDETDSAALRLRSLRLVGRVVVVFGLILVVSSMLVGRGTIFEWVFSTCWLASIPLLLVLVQWWKDVVFVRTKRVRKPTRLQRWVLANSKGWWTSFAAAAVGGVYLFATSAARAARNWVGRFVITRRALAYLFRRRLDKREQVGLATDPISPASFVALGPEHPSATRISTASDEALQKLADRLRARKGGVIAIVGERGMGKSTALRKLLGDGSDAILVTAPSSCDAEPIRERLAESVGVPTTTSLEETASILAASPNIHGLLLDDAQHFIQPVVGGLAVFDALLAVASRNTERTTWVFALDRVIWQFLQRSRGARPLFDDVVLLDSWREEEIVRLVETRNAEAGLSPSFESLLEPLPATADEVDKQEALAQRAADYYRLLWDAAAGNPGVALHMWRRSLGTDSSGKTVVRPSTALDTSDLERLPDASVFVLRAVLQLTPATAERISAGSVLGLAMITDALRYAASRGYIEERDGGFRVTWTWFRAITLFLQRKHLLTR